MYLSKLPSGGCGGWGIVEDLPEDAKPNEGYDYEDLRECTVLWGVNIPGENRWMPQDAGEP